MERAEGGGPLRERFVPAAGCVRMESLPNPAEFAPSGRHPSGPETLSHSLLRQVQAHDERAWRRLVDLFGEVVYRWCLAAGLQPADAADVGQETFAAVHRAIGGFRREHPQDSFCAWLRTVVRHKILDFRRRAQRRVDRPVGGTDAQAACAELPADGDSDDSATVAAAESRRLWERAAALIRQDFEPQTWHAFRLTALENRPTAEAAAALGMRPDAVRKARSRVLARLRSEFGDLIPGG